MICHHYMKPDTTNQTRYVYFANLVINTKAQSLSFNSVPCKSILHYAGSKLQEIMENIMMPDKV
jgi:hypothetical protein